MGQFMTNQIRFRAYDYKTEKVYKVIRLEWGKRGDLHSVIMTPLTGKGNKKISRFAEKVRLLVGIPVIANNQKVVYEGSVVKLETGEKVLVDRDDIPYFEGQEVTVIGNIFENPEFRKYLTEAGLQRFNLSKKGEKK